MLPFQVSPWDQFIRVYLLAHPCSGHVLIPKGSYRLFWASYLRYIGTGSWKVGTPNRIVLFYGIIFGQTQQPQIQFYIFCLHSFPSYLEPKYDGEVGSNRICCFRFDRGVLSCAFRSTTKLPSGIIAHPAHVGLSPRQRGLSSAGSTLSIYTTRRFISCRRTTTMYAPGERLLSLWRYSQPTRNGAEPGPWPSELWFWTWMTTRRRRRGKGEESEDGGGPRVKTPSASPPTNGFLPGAVVYSAQESRAETPRLRRGQKLSQARPHPVRESFLKLVQLAKRRKRFSLTARAAAGRQCILYLRS